MDFTSFEKKAAYLFGHGLSYTTFCKKVDSCVIKDDYTAIIRAEITNTGKVSGKEVLSVYAQIKGELEQPVRRLVGFAKTKELASNENQIVTIEIPANRFASYDAKEEKWVIESGEIALFIGGAADCNEKIRMLMHKKFFINY